MQTLRNDELIKLTGQSRLRAYRPGALQKWLDCGLTLAQAQDQAKGDLISDITVKNLIVTLGKGLVADLLIDVVGTGLTYHAIGTSATAPAVSDTVLGTEAARKTFTIRGRVGNVVSLSVFYTKAESTFNIKEAGIFGGALASSTPGSGTLFSHYAQAEDNSAGTKDLTFDYDLTIN